MTTYANLKNYNEDYGYYPGKMIRTNSILTEQENYSPTESLPLLIDCPMEGYFYDPAVDTSMSGYLTLVALEDSFVFTLRMRHGKGILGANLQIVDSTGEPGKILTHLYASQHGNHTKNTKTGMLSKGTVQYADLNMSKTSFLSAVKDESIMATITTKDYPDGEIAGLLHPVFP